MARVDWHRRVRGTRCVAAAAVVASVVRAIVVAAIPAWVGIGCVALPRDLADDEPEAGPVTVLLPVPRFHHVHINSVDPERSIAWWQTVWPAGAPTVIAGYDAFEADGVALLYTRVEAPPPGAFDPELHRAVPQSAFWTFGPSTDGRAFYERLAAVDPNRERFRFLPVYTGPDDTEGVPHSGLGPFGDELLTVDELLERRRDDPPRRRQGTQDFGYIVDPDGVLVEFNGNADTDDLFHGHTHFWHEEPLCAVNWYVEHLGVRSARAPFDPCDVEVGPVSYATFIPDGQLRQPIGVVGLANASWAWYTRQCRSGRCGEEGDRPLVPSRGQVVDHVALSYPDLDVVTAHLAARGMPLVEGPYPFGETRAVLIEDVDGLAVELVEDRMSRP